MIYLKLEKATADLVEGVLCLFLLDVELAGLYIPVITSFIHNIASTLIEGFHSLV